MSFEGQAATIMSFAQTGEGVAVIDGRRVLVAGTMPGDRVRLTMRAERVTEVALETRAAGRLVPPCAIVDACGGCTWQHVPPEMQRDARIEQLRRALPTAWRDAPIVYVPAEKRYGYRTRARLAWASRPSARLGFRGRSSHALVDVPSCPVFAPALDAALAPLRDELARLGGEGEVSLALGREGLPVANLRPSGRFAVEGYALPERLVARGFAGAAIWAPEATAPTIAGDPQPMVRGGDGEWLRLGVQGFAQANESLNAALAAHVVREAQADGRVVLELFAGAGNFTVLLARAAAKLFAVESDREAVSAMQANLAARGITNVRASIGDAGAATDRKADVVVLDPPRTGARDVCEALAKKPPRRLVYVSCDGPTFGRDAAALARSMTLERIDAFEMFPHTPHLEIVATFTKTLGKHSQEDRKTGRA